jgi:anti-sigma factor RsiW
MSGPGPDCDMVLLVQAEFDGELDAAQAAALAAHRAQCPICRAAETDLAAAHALTRGASYALSDEARRRMVQRLTPLLPVSVNRRRGWWRTWWTGVFGFGLGAACAAGLAVVLLSPVEEGLTRQLVASHIRALQPGHLEDVVSTDKHTVKPWFDGRLDFAPPVKDLANNGFPLKGARLDYLDGRAVAALVYQRDKHIIDLYIWPTAMRADAPSRMTESQGYNVVHWRWNGMMLSAVSDLEAAQLRTFAEDWQHTP